MVTKPDETSPPITKRCRRCGGPVTTAGEGNLRYTGCEVCGEEHVEEAGFACSHCGVDNVADANQCAGCGALRGSHPEDRELDDWEERLRVVQAGAGTKLHLGSLGSSITFCGHVAATVASEDLSRVDCKACRKHWPAIFNRLT